MDTNICTWHY